MVIAIDFDGTITKESKYPEIGELRNDAITCIKKLQEHGHECFLWTCRQGKTLTDAINALLEAGIAMSVMSPYDFSVAFGRKPIADVYIDDLAFKAYGESVDWSRIESNLLKGGER